MRRFLLRHWRLLLILAPGIFLALLCILSLVFPRQGLINRANFNRIEPGMTRVQVELLLQCNPSVFTFSRNDCVALRKNVWGYTYDRPDQIPPTDTIWIEFDLSTDRVVNKWFTEPKPDDLRQHLANRLNTAIGRSPPFPRQPPWLPAGPFRSPEPAAAKDGR